MKNAIKVAILEDQPDISANLCALITEDQDLELLAVYSSSEEALEDNLRQKNIDVFLVDLGLPGLDGINFIAKAKRLCPQANFMVHTVSESGEKLWSALAVGAIGYVLKGSHREEILEGLKIVARGNTLLSPRMAAKLIRFFSTIAGPISPLSKREMDILQGLKSGHTYGEIAETRFLSPHTVHTHIKKIYQKLNVTNRADAVIKAAAFNLLTEGG
ncbi:MAG: response regulator transcription factor [Pseudomonadota bacterium]